MITVAKNGIEVMDCGNYFRVVYDHLEVSTVAKSAAGFQTACELLAYLQDKRGIFQSRALKAELAARLPEWCFSNYGIDGAVACYPPNGTNAAAYRELSEHAPISSVAGPLYVVTKARGL